MRINLLSCLIASSIIGTPAAALPRIDDSNEKSVYETSVLEDLRELDGFNEHEVRSDFEFLYMCDYNYAPDSAENYDLFMYFYVKDSSLFRNMCYTYIGIGDNGDYFRQDLVFRSYENGYCKVSLPLSKRVDFFEENFSGETDRTYRISSVNVMLRGSYTYTKAYEVSRVYTISGYASGIFDDEGDLSVSWTGDKTISIEVEAGVWSSEAYFDFRNNIFYTYFDIPENLFDDYGDLVSVHYSYEKILLKPLFHFLSSYNWRRLDSVGHWKGDIYDHYLGFTHINPMYVVIADTFGDIEKQNAYAWDNATLSLMGYSNSIKNLYTYASNRSQYVCMNSNFIKNSTVFTSNNYYEDFLGENVVERYLQNPSSLTYKSFGRSDVTKDAEDFGDLATTNIVWNEFDDSEMALRNNYWGLSFSNKEYRDDAKYWEILDDSKLSATTEDFSDYYFVREDDVSDIKSRIENNSVNGTKTVLLRYGNELQNVRNLFDTTAGIGGGYECVGVASLQYLYKDFQIIDFTFETSGVESVIGVIHDPVTTTADIPGIPELGSSDEWKKTLMTILSIIAGIVILVLIAVGLYYLMPFVYQFMNDPVRQAHRKERARRYTERQNKRRKRRRKRG